MKAENFIEERTKKCSNLAHFEDLNGNVWEENTPWLTPDQARKAVEIAREEMVEEGIKFLKDHLEGYDIFGSDIERSIETFKLAMQDE